MIQKNLNSPPPPLDRLTAALATALVALTLALPMTTQAQTVGFGVCPAGASPTINPQNLTITHGDPKTYPDWFSRATPATESNAVTVKVASFGLGQVNGPYSKDGTQIQEPGTATSATYLLGLVGDNGQLVHGFYTVIAYNARGTVPAQTSTFHSLQPNTRYAVTVFVDDVRGETVATRLPVVAKRPLFRQCVQTAP